MHYKFLINKVINALFGLIDRANDIILKEISTGCQQPKNKFGSNSTDIFKERILQGVMETGAEKRATGFGLSFLPEFQFAQRVFLFRFAVVAVIVIVMMIIPIAC